MSTGTVGGYTVHHQSCSIFTKGTCTCPPSYKQETAESWHKVHAALLKSVAESQAKLLAGINELPREVFAQFQRCIEPASASQIASQKSVDALSEQLDDLKVLIAQTQAAVRNSHGTLVGRLDAIGGVLAELLSPKQPPRRQSKRRKR